MENYMTYLHSQISDSHLDGVIRKYKSCLEKSKMFKGFDESNVYFRSFMRIILANPHTIGEFFDQVLKSSCKASLTRKRTEHEFAFMLPSGNTNSCVAQYVSLTPLGVLFFLLSWFKFIHPSVTRKYIHESEFKCLKQAINACKFDTTTLLDATYYMNTVKQISVCDAIDRAQQTPAPIVTDFKLYTLRVR